ncbi:MAG: FAD-dependent oxidoreductase, partial [Anaerolineales bacterium]|nr:FAD-dependent oxidoreductase [Anaerolineales bacterium]
MGNSVSLNRLQKIKQLRQNPDIQVLIVGAGVNGIGLFRELALQGIYVALIDEGDFGTDSPIAISHLVHGDVYYRENGGFGSAETAVLERQRLLQNAPHVVIPMPTTVPIFRWVTGRFHVPIKLPKEALKTGRRGLFFTRLGLMLQDKMLGSKVDSFKHRFAFRKKSLKQFPRLNPNILGTVSYYNATIIAPERLCTDLLWDGCEASPQSVPLNYFGQTALDGDSVTVTDFITGETVQLRPQLVINTKDCPPQTDNIHRQQGLHLVLANSELRQVISNHSFFFEYE